MNAGPTTSRAPQRAPESGARRAGHTRITPRAMTRVIEQITAEAFGIPPAAVTVDIHDVKGRLGITARVSLPAPDLLQEGHAGPSGNEKSSVYERASGARATVIRRAGLVAGAAVERVDIRVTGIQQRTEARVR